MKYNFIVDYRTSWGEALYITGNIPALGNGDPARALPMSLHDTETWHAEIETEMPAEGLEYSYIVRHENGSTRREWGSPRRVVPIPGISRYEFFDRWQDQPWDKPYYASAFVDCINNRPKRENAVNPVNGMVNLCVSAPMVAPDEVLAVSGDIPALGEWDPAKALRMSDANFPEWSVNISLRDVKKPFEYKFLIIKKATGEVVAWEGRENRQFDRKPFCTDEAMVVGGMRFVNPLQPWKGAGTAIPVFSLRSNEDFGVGDFYDLFKMVDWAAKTDQKMVQLLPINDTTMSKTWVDSYPYNSNSTFALHPMYLRLEAMGTLKDKNRMAWFDEQRKALNALSEIDYELVNNIKGQYTRELFEQDGKKVVASKAFKTFVKDNKHWLLPYAAFCVLRDVYGTPEMSKWGEFAEYDENKVNKLIDEHRAEVDYVCYLQYFLDKQLREATAYAHSKGVALKGDIPIGISRTSADAWTQPRLFYLDSQAGAPPDDFSIQGQNWGFPTYNWEEMGRDGFAWWKSRFRNMSRYFDAYRIDHVLGFFRIWQIPMKDVHGLLGFFNSALPFSADELRNNYDFWINVDVQTKPFIMDWFLGDFFGEYTDEARNRFMHHVGGGRYELNDDFKTQRQVVEYFENEEKNDKNNRLRDALLGLQDNVLFIEDPYQPGKYHPRIAGQMTYCYRSLNDYEKWCFDRLYNDFFYRRNNDYWYGKAMWKLPPLIDATDMLVCAEDLGMIPDCVPSVMQQLEILSLEIQRMPKDPRSEFGNTWSYPYYSVCTTSTHDMPGIRQWWEEDRNKTQRYYNNVLHEGGEAPVYAEPWVCQKILDLNLKSPSMLCILPLQDWLSMDGSMRRHDPREEQINVPANPRHYWRYRMHLTLDELNDAEAFNHRVKGMVADSGR